MAIKVTGLNSGLDTDSIIKELMSAHSLKLTKVENKKTKNTWTQDKWKEMNAKIYALYTGDLSTARLAGSYKTKKAVSSNSDYVDATASTNAAAGAHTIKVNELASAQYVTGGKVAATARTDKLTSVLGVTAGTVITIDGADTNTDGTVNDNKITFTVDDDTTVADFVSNCKNAGLNASFDTTQQRFFISSKTSGVDQAFSISAEKDGVDVSNAELAKLGLGKIENGVLDTGATVNGLTVVQAKDAEIVLDGAVITCSSNETEINGIKLSLKQQTAEAVTITVSNDTDAVYDMVKSFINTYNDVLGAMNTAYYAGSSKGYDPLSDDDKEAMTDDQIEKWETKIKDSLLRRDTTLGSLITAFKGAMNTPITASDGKTYTLASLGICTSTDYNEKGLLHIKGDKDDSTYADSTNTLQKMLEEKPEIVAEVIQGVADKLYTTMTKKMGSTSLSSALTFYNDKQLTKNNTNYEKEISKLKTKLEEIEERYYKQFTAMETALAKLNQQQSSLSSLLG